MRRRWERGMGESSTPTHQARPWKSESLLRDTYASSNSRIKRTHRVYSLYILFASISFESSLYVTESEPISAKRGSCRGRKVAVRVQSGLERSASSSENSAFRYPH